MEIVKINNSAWDWFVYHSLVIISSSLSSKKLKEPPDKEFYTLAVSSGSQYNLSRVLLFPKRYKKSGPLGVRLQCSFPKGPYLLDFSPSFQMWRTAPRIVLYVTKLATGWTHYRAFRQRLGLWWCLRGHCNFTLKEKWWLSSHGLHLTVRLFRKLQDRVKKSKSMWDSLLEVEPCVRKTVGGNCETRALRLHFSPRHVTVAKWLARTSLK